MKKENKTRFIQRHKSEHTLVRDGRIFDEMDYNIYTLHTVIRQLAAKLFGEMWVSCTFQSALFV